MILTMNKHGIGGIDQEILDLIVKVIINQKQVDRVVIFGSRAGDSFTRTSDIDIAVFGGNWTETDTALAKDMLEESISTPLKFDLLNYAKITKDYLKRMITENGKVIYDKRPD